MDSPSWDLAGITSLLLSQTPPRNSCTSFSQKADKTRMEKGHRFLWLTMNFVNKRSNDK